ncbi:MAG: 30S ribosome-binding factor RbfA [Planctomycetes bacterium]|nr:30S ribosome-binding factor RbfA [Planctomycetota bacterium]MCB9905860.1 30S ribosome-binding factor RbfA [Planctomycetota bacterium]
MANPRTIARMEARIKERAAYCLQFELNDPRAGLVTITKVELAQDLQSGKIFYSTLGDESDRNKCMAMLASAAGYVQRQVARVLETRTVPHLSFHFDESLERAANMDRLINEALKKDGEVRGDE